MISLNPFFNRGIEVNKAQKLKGKIYKKFMVDRGILWAKYESYSNMYLFALRDNFSFSEGQWIR